MLVQIFNHQTICNERRVERGTKEEGEGGRKKEREKERGRKTERRKKNRKTCYVTKNLAKLWTTECNLSHTD